MRNFSLNFLEKFQRRECKSARPVGTPLSLRRRVPLSSLRDPTSVKAFRLRAKGTCFSASPPGIAAKRQFNSSPRTEHVVAPAN